MQEVHGLVAQRRLVNLYAADADEILQNLVKQNKVWTFRQQRHDLVCPRSDTSFVLLAHDLVAFLTAQRPRDPAPHRLGTKFLAGDFLTLGRIEKLTIEDGCADFRRSG